MRKAEAYRISRRQFCNYVRGHSVIQVDKNFKPITVGIMHIHSTYFIRYCLDGRESRHYWNKGDVVYKNDNIYCVKNEEQGYELWYVDKDPVAIKVKRGE